MIRSATPAVGGAALALTLLLGATEIASRGRDRDAGMVTPAIAADFRVVARERFAVPDTGGTFQIGAYSIVFPAHAICDPRTSGYGDDLWDKPCRSLRAPVEIRAEVRSGGGETWIDFSPSLRFVPSQDSAKWVRLSVRPHGVGGAAAMRRLKHFSGYQVHAG
jgi:hypothetical protein